MLAWATANPTTTSAATPAIRSGAEGLPTGVTVSLSGKNIGDLMNEKDVTWGWFQGGFAPSAAKTPPMKNAPCAARTTRTSAARP